MTLRFARVGPDGRKVDANPFGWALEYDLEPGRTTYGGVEATAWHIRPGGPLTLLDEAGRFEMALVFEPEGEGPRFFFTEVIEVTE